MQMFANDPQYIVEDMLKGYAKAHSDIVAPTDNPRVFKTAQPVREGKVGIVTGGGSMRRGGFLQELEADLKEAGFEVKLIEGVESDPSVETVMKGAAVMSEFEPDWIVAIGGGSGHVD